MDSSKGSTPWSLLFAEISGKSGRFAEDPPFSQKDNVLPRQLLLKLSHQTALDLLVDFLLRVWNVDHNCYLKQDFIFIKLGG